MNFSDNTVQLFLFLYFFLNIIEALLTVGTVMVTSILRSVGLSLGLWCSYGMCHCVA